MQMAVLNFKNQLTDLLFQINSHMNNTFSPLYCPYGLTPAQIRLLLELRRQDHRTVGDLSRNLCLANGNTSAMCKKLSAEGFILRSRDQDDERVVKVSLTQSGYEVIGRIEACLEDKFRPVFTNQSEDDLADILKGLEKLNALLTRLQQVIEESPPQA